MFETAPAAIVRMTMWPRERLHELQELELAGLALADEGGVRYEQAYDAAMARQRRRLWAATVGDRAFRCAVSLASPAMATALSRFTTSSTFEPPARRNKRVRHFETSMFRYLARATGRIDPCGLWAGVGIATFGTAEQTSFTARPARVRIDPDLGPFRSIFRALCRRQPYASLGRFRVNPSLRRHDDGRWSCGRKDESGAVQWLALPASPLVELVGGLHCEPGGSALERIERAIAERLHDAAMARPIVELLRSEGLLIGGLDFPRRFETPADALRQAETELRGSDREHWRAARVCVENECDALGRAVEATLAGEANGADVAEVLATNERVRAAISQLVSALQLPDIPIPDATLRCDLRIPFAIELGRHDAAQIDRMLDDWTATERREGGLLRHRRRAAEVLLGQSTIELTQPPVEARAIAFEQSGPAAGPPLGALVCRPGRRGLAEPWIRGLSDAPTATHARHAALLESAGDPLLAWFRRAFDELAATTGIEVVDLVTEDVGSPNVLSRPRYVERCVDPWRCGGVEIGRDARLGLGPSDSAVVLAIGERLFSAYSFTAATIDGRDVVVERLAATSWWSGGRRSSSARSARRRSTAGGRVVSPGRTRLPSDEVRTLVESRGAERFRRWVQCARAHGWSDLVRVACADRPALLIPTCSPLAIEAVFEGVTAGNRVVVEEVLDAAWVAGPEGTHGVELVVPVRRLNHAWERAEELLDAVAG